MSLLPGKLLRGPVLWLALTSLLPGAMASAAEVTWDPASARLSVIAENEALAEVLASLAEQTGLRVDVAPGVESRISLAFDQLSLADGLRRLTLDSNAVIRYREQADGELRPYAVRLLPDGGAVGAGGVQNRIEAPPGLYRRAQTAEEIAAIDKVLAGMEQRLSAAKPALRERLARDSGERIERLVDRELARIRKP